MPRGQWSTNLSFAFPTATSPRVSSELEQARPQTSGEEELQLQLALAMSREVAEQVVPRPLSDALCWGGMGYCAPRFGCAARDRTSLLLTSPSWRGILRKVIFRKGF